TSIIQPHAPLTHSLVPHLRSSVLHGSLDMAHDVDEAGSHGHAVRIDLASSVSVDLANSGDAVCANRHIAWRRIAAVAVIQQAVADHDVVRGSGSRAGAEKGEDDERSFHGAKDTRAPHPALRAT